MQVVILFMNPITLPCSLAHAGNDIIVIFWCTSELRYLNWKFMRMTEESPTTFSYTMKVNLTQDFSLVARVTFNNGSFINASVTILRPINLNGGMINCNRDILTLNIPANTFLVTGFEN